MIDALFELEGQSVEYVEVDDSKDDLSAEKFVDAENKLNISPDIQ